MRLAVLLTFGFFVWLGGFVLFVLDAESFSAQHHLDPSITIQNHKKPQAIIVLTGGKNRIKEGLTLLKKNYADKLLISGVTRDYSKADVIRISGFKGKTERHKLFIDDKATTTIENAKFSKLWLEKHNISSLILVTSTYHMRRSLLEFEVVSPNIHIYPYGINPLKKGVEPWSVSRKMLLLYITEYMKYLGALSKAKLVTLYKTMALIL